MVAVDALNSSALSKLRRVASVCDISVRAYVRDGGNTTAGVIQDADPDIAVREVTALTSSTTPIIRINRLDMSSCMKLAFRGNRLNLSVIVGLVLYHRKYHYHLPLPAMHAAVSRPWRLSIHISVLPLCFHPRQGRFSSRLQSAAVVLDIMIPTLKGATVFTMK